MQKPIQKLPTTDELIALKFPNLKGQAPLLHKLNDKLGRLIAENGGFADLCVRFKAGVAQWLDWSQRDIMK